jgi:hypothetical protein
MSKVTVDKSEWFIDQKKKKKALLALREWASKGGISMGRIAVTSQAIAGDEETAKKPLNQKGEIT